ncbi:putative GNAT family acetyltransferase [Parabacteroides sp. PFB2-12]|uniref:GNAT family N-acetyltransferase n=1 Tax=unclassified Parabacteroides TaxID=2649774 RepID=UPI002474EBE3|nr:MULTISPECIES: GNAT family N-acetyltransferase [unclassified Parabacteroides]MDH6343024.1 putative GNAT family acetyltransferase [Parabacteroides sp. PM6-13]MDH6390961.1 putative GNAT family acetyltransferase [Parabacteroides sp. PFB2-12]
MEQQYELIKNDALQQFEFNIKGYTPLIEFVMIPDGDVFLTHTEVPMSLAGQGVGTQLVKETLEYLDENNLRVVPLCPFVASYIQKHPEWEKIVVH